MNRSTLLPESSSRRAEQEVLEETWNGTISTKWVSTWKRICLLRCIRMMAWFLAHLRVQLMLPFVPRTSLRRRVRLLPGSDVLSLLGSRCGSGIDVPMRYGAKRNDAWGVASKPRCQARAQSHKDEGTASYQSRDKILSCTRPNCHDDAIW
jgi:hypothetical protein